MTTLSAEVALAVRADSGEGPAWDAQTNLPVFMDIAAAKSNAQSGKTAYFATVTSPAR